MSSNSSLTFNPSFLTQSAWARLGVSIVLLLLLWAAIHWAVSIP